MEGWQREKENRNCFDFHEFDDDSETQKRIWRKESRLCLLWTTLKMNQDTLKYPGLLSASDEHKNATGNIQISEPFEFWYLQVELERWRNNDDVDL
jgi:hypothetical protein